MLSNKIRITISRGVQTINLKIKLEGKSPRKMCNNLKNGEQTLTHNPKFYWDCKSSAVIPSARKEIHSLIGKPFF